MGINFTLNKCVTMRVTFACLLLCGTVNTVSAQQAPANAGASLSLEQVRVTGIVRDTDNTTLPGVTVLIEGTNKVTMTDHDGRFTIDAPRGSQLQFSFVGMQARKVKVENSKPLEIVLKTDAALLGEVVITGYNQTTTRRTTGSVAVLKSDDIKGSPLKSVDQLMQGKVAGVSIATVSGRPGETAKVRIRGINTISGNAEPLWVVDGVPLQKDIPRIFSSRVKTGDLNSLFTDGIAGINPNDIESITVLKDASAAAIYGSRAAGGVIVITTKRGEAGKMKVNYATNASMVMRPQRDANLMNSREKIAWEQQLWEEYSQAGFRNGSYYPVVGIVGMVRSGKNEFAGMSETEQDAYLQGLEKNSTDWFGELFDNSLSQSHYLSLSGGKESHTYYLSLGYSNNNGLVKNTGYDRYNVNAKFNIKANDRLSLGFISDLSMQGSKGPSLNTDPFRYAYFANPYESPYNADGSYRRDNTFYNLKRINGGYDVALPPGGFNIMRELNETSNEVNSFSGTVTMDLNYKINDKFRFIGLASSSYTDNRTDNINGKDTYAAFTDRPFLETPTSTRTYGSITQTSASNLSYTMRGQLQYDNEINYQHGISALVGSEIRGQQAKSIFEKRYGYDPLSGNSSIPLPPRPDNSDQIDYNKLISYANIIDGLSGQSITEDAFASFYAALDYVYNRKYIASFTARTDGSNNFGSEQQFNPTWSAGLSWNVDQEPFMEVVKPVLSTLSLRVATGYTGNINKTVYPQLVMDYDPSFRKTYDDYYRMGNIRNAPNKNLRWEKTHDVKAALSFGLFRDRITGLVEAYTRRSKDLVTEVRVPSSTGFITQKYNTSEVSNKGLEFTLNTLNIKTTDFSWRTSANIAYNQNKLTRYVSPTGAIYGNNYVGYPLGSIFSGRLQGIDPETGIYQFELRSDSEIRDEKDLRQSDNYLFYLGTSNAPVTGGFSTTVNYKNFSLSLGGSYSLGGKIRNDITSPASYNSIETNDSNKGDREPIMTPHNDLYGNHLNLPRDRQNRWTPENPRTDAYPRIIDYFGPRLYLDRTSPMGTIITSAALLENVSYLRVNNMAFTYMLDERYTQKVGVESVGLSLSVSNLLTFTDYKGLDPEAPGAVYPISRSVTVGINVGF